MIAGVRRMHDRVAGTTTSGEAYRANDPELLNWVHGTAAYGFVQAYDAYVRPLSLLERDCYYAEGITAAALYGATSAASEVELETLFQDVTDRLERSDIVFEFSCHHAVCAHPAAAVKARAASAGAGCC